MGNRVEIFVKQWVSDNVRAVPGLSDLLIEIDRLAAKMTADARETGIAGLELEKSLGDIDIYLTHACEEAHEPLKGV